MRKKFKFLTVCIIFIIILGFGKAYNVYGYTKKTNVLEDNSQTSYAKDKTPSADNTLKIYDYAKLIPDDKEKEIYNMIKKFISKYNMDMAIVTINENPKSSSMGYADDFYDYNGYGIGTDKSGILLLVSMEARDWHITTTGFGIRAITDAGLDYISDQFLPYLSDGEYLDAFETYADLCDEFLTQAKTGNAYDGDHMPKGAYPWLKNLLIALGSGVVIALLIVEGMRRSLKSVKMQRSAENYVRAGSIQVTRRQDHFLYTRTSKSARPKNNSGSSGSSTHTSSSGTSHGGGGGKF